MVVVGNSCGDMCYSARSLQDSPGQKEVCIDWDETLAYYVNNRYIPVKEDDITVYILLCHKNIVETCLSVQCEENS